MPTLFDPIRVGRMALSNRVAMAPLTRNRAPGAGPPAITATYYAQRASAGLLVTEGTAISGVGMASGARLRVSGAITMRLASSKSPVCTESNKEDIEIS